MRPEQLCQTRWPDLSITSSAATSMRLGRGGRDESEDVHRFNAPSAAYDFPASSRNDITASKSFKQFFSMMMP